MHGSIGYVFILMAAALWSLTGPLCLYCLKAGMTPMEIAFWRTTLGAIFFCVHAKATGSLRLQTPRDGLAFFLFGAVCLGGLFSVYQGAVHAGGAALAAILLYTAPVWVAVASWLLFKEQLSGGKILAIGISLAGVACISLSGSGGIVAVTPLAVILGLSSGVLYSVHFIFTKRYLERYSPFALYGFCMTAAAVACFPFVSLDLDRVFSVWAPLLTVCVLCSYCAFWVYSEGIRRVDPTKAVVLATIEPMLATFVAWWWWDEFFAPAGWIGTALVMTAVFLIIIDGSRAPARANKAVA